jgi:UDPglucose 6-dehydrogenase
MNNNDIIIGIVGYGYVGKAFCNFFKNYYKILIYDPMYYMTNSQEEINNQCQYAFICVPTPSNEDGSCNISMVEESVKWLTVPNILIKSTVEPGTTKALSDKYQKKVAFSPEYIGENKYWSPHKFMTDVKETPFFIFGGETDLCEKFINLYQTITGPDKSYHITDSLTAETIKYVENSFYATKVAFCNELYDLCKKTGISYNKVREMWLLDPRMNKSFTSVFPDNRGFGGKCFPKDVKAFLKYSQNNNSNLSILDSVIKSNDIIRNSKNNS